MFAYRGLGDAEVTARLVACEHAIAAAQAEQLGLIAEVHRRAPGWILPADPDGVHLEPVLVAAAEIGPLLHLAPPTAVARVELAVGLTSRLPGTLAALSRGEVDLPRARAIVEATNVLDAADAAAVEALVLPRAATQTAAGVRVSARRAAIAVCPTAAQARHDAAVADRQVRMFPLEDGMAQLAVTGPAAAVRSCFQRITRLARDRRHVGAGPPGPDTPHPGGHGPHTGADDGLDARRADLVLDLLAGGDLDPTEASHARHAHDDRAPERSGPDDDRRSTSVAATVAVTVDWQVLAGLTEDPATLDGYGPITAATARELAHSPASTWRRLLTDPRTGAVTDIATRSYRPPAALDRLIRTRDHTCRFPGCGHPATRCDLDHTTRYPDGPTHPDNLAALCRRHHHLKHHTRWRMHQHPGGVIDWTSPTGAHHRTDPPPIGAPPATPDTNRAQTRCGTWPPGDPPPDAGPPDNQLLHQPPPYDGPRNDEPPPDAWADPESWARITALADLHCPPLPEPIDPTNPAPEPNTNPDPDPDQQAAA